MNDLRIDGPDAECVAFLCETPALAFDLAGAVHPLEEAFGDARITARMDGRPRPLCDESPLALQVVVWVRCTPGEALDRLHRFYHKWLDTDGSGHRGLAFDVGFEEG